MTEPVAVPEPMDESSTSTPSAASATAWRISAGKRVGRGHRNRGEPCQDAYATRVDVGRGRAIAAVADGLGSRPLSHLGSQAACDAAVASLAAEATWDRDALLRAFAAARQAVADVAAAQGLGIDDLATTLQVAAAWDGKVIAGMVGDGAIVCGAPAQVLLAPPTSGYANEVVPLTAARWAEFVQVAEAEAAGPLLLFSDGLTRLLLARERTGWAPFAPFFEKFLPQVQDAFDDGLAQRFLDRDQIDQSWDDDKCLVVITQAKQVDGHDA